MVLRDLAERRAGRGYRGEYLSDGDGRDAGPAMVARDHNGAEAGAVEGRDLGVGTIAVQIARGGVFVTPAQVAEALLDYWKLGVSTFLIRGFDPLEAAVAYGESLLPLTRELIARDKAMTERVPA